MAEHRGISESVLRSSCCSPSSLPVAVVVFVWPGFVMRFLRISKLLSVSVIGTRAPYALCAKPAWWKQPHLQNRVDSRRAPGGHRVSPTIRKLMKPCSAIPMCSFANGSFHPCSFRHDSGLDVTPQIHHQSPRHGHDADSPHSWSARAESLLIPSTQPALRLIP